jgi:hypothetical protein
MGVLNDKRFDKKLKYFFIKNIKLTPTNKSICYVVVKEFQIIVYQ